jgi:hypothetical protein
VVFVDETPIDLQVRGKSRMQQAYMWIYVGGGGGDPPYRFFEFCLNRNHDNPLTTLKGYKGVFHSDKYGATRSWQPKMISLGVPAGPRAP